MRNKMLLMTIFCLCVLAARAGITPVSPSVCVGSTLTLVGSPGGGTWTSTNTGVATISSGGVVTGVAAGTTTISYVQGASTFTATLTVGDVMPDPITGNPVVCITSHPTLACSPSGGTWSSSNTSVATIDASGQITGVAAGTPTFTYSLAGCISTITGKSWGGASNIPIPTVTQANICTGATTTLGGESYPGGTWYTSNPTIVNVNATTGVVTGLTAGSGFNLYYSFGSGCERSTSVVTVYTTPGAITGNASICVGSVSTLSCDNNSGVYSSSNTGIASLGTGAGQRVVTGVSGGVATITYTKAICISTLAVSVTAAPSAITGVLRICGIGGTTTLGNSVAGGTWISGNTSVATINSSGVVTGVDYGTSVITYKTVAGATTCGSVTATVTVSPNPDAITGLDHVCSEGATITLASTTGGGSWTSSNTSWATVDASGVVEGGDMTDDYPAAVCENAVTISYTLSTGCFATKSVTVRNNTDDILRAWPGEPPAAWDPTSMCVGRRNKIKATGGFSIGCGTAGWTASNYSVLSIENPATWATYLVGVAPGTATVTYTRGNGCSVTMDVTVGATTSPITGSLSVCAGDDFTLSCDDEGGAWTPMHPSGETGPVDVESYSDIASVSVANLTAHYYSAANTPAITYTLPSGACREVNVSVNAEPAEITGPTCVVLGGTITLGNSIVRGAWSSSNVAVVTVGSLSTTSAVVTPVAVGAVTISYTTICGTETTNISVVSTPCGARFAPADNNPETPTAVSFSRPFVLYPNPNNGIFTLSGNVPATRSSTMKIEVTDVLGKIIYTDEVKVENGKVNKSISLNDNHAKGVYLIRVKNDEVSQIVRFTLE